MLRVILNPVRDYFKEVDLFTEKEDVFKNQENYGSRNQSFTFRGSRGKNHDGYSNYRNNNVNAQCYNYQEYGHYALNCSKKQV